MKSVVQFEALQAAILFIIISALSAKSAVESLPNSSAVALFNGNDLTGWQPVNGHADNWVVAGGVLTWNGGEGARLIVTKAVYADFELRLEFNYAAYSEELRKEHPGLLRTEGHIGLQSKPDSKIKFRNLTLRAIAPQE